MSGSILDQIARGVGPEPDTKMPARPPQLAEGLAEIHPDEIGATSVHGTFETCRRPLRMSAYWVGPEVTVR
jgi:hypothetical protein